MTNNNQFFKRILRKYLFPSILTILSTTFISFINNIIVGRMLGKQALGIINIVSSFIFLFSMRGCLISIGASTCASIAIGKDKGDKTGEYTTHAFLMFLHLGMEFTGIAISVVISTAAADVAGLILLFSSKERHVRLRKIPLSEIINISKSVLKRGSAAGFNNLCNMLRTMILSTCMLKYLGPGRASVFAVAGAVINFTVAGVVGSGQIFSLWLEYFTARRLFLLESITLCCLSR